MVEDKQRRCEQNKDSVVLGGRRTSVAKQKQGVNKGKSKAKVGEGKVKQRENESKPHTKTPKQYDVWVGWGRVAGRSSIRRGRTDVR